MALITLSRLLRVRYYYSVPQAGAQIGLGRTGSYDAVKAGLISIERAGKGGKLMLVPREKWDRRVKQLLRDPQRKLPVARKRRTSRKGSAVISAMPEAP